MKKKLSVFLALMALAVSLALPAYADNDVPTPLMDGYSFNVAPGVSQFNGASVVFPNTTFAVVAPKSFSADYSGDKLWFGVYKTNSVAQPVSQTKWIDGLIDNFSLDYNSPQNTDTYLYLRGFGSSSNRGMVASSGLWYP